MSPNLELEAALAAGVKEGKVPHAILYATNKDGSFHYQHATGFQNCGVDDKPIEEDAILMLASQTKLLTSIAALQVVERGLVGLDDDVAPHLPELASSQILKGFDEDDKPILKDRTKPITLRHLLTHTSGANYGMAPIIQKYKKQTDVNGADLDLSSPVVKRFNNPLMFEPGEGWMYSPGLDWTGLLIERLTHMTLEEYEKQNMWDPLGLTGITFWPHKNPALKDKVPQLVDRAPDGGLVPHTTPHLNTRSVDCFGGHGCYARLSDYLEVQRSLLANDGRLLKPESVEELFKPQLGERSARFLQHTLTNHSAMFISEFNADIPMNHGLGGVLFMADDAGRRKKGTMSWGGMVNPFWLIDREAGLALTFGTQLLPNGDPRCKEVVSLAERAMYSMAGVQF